MGRTDPRAAHGPRDVASMDSPAQDVTAKLKDLPRRIRFKIRFGRMMWSYLHESATRWGCERCRPSLSVWMEGLHDAVNLRLGKRVFKQGSLAKFRAGALEGRYHATCFGCRTFRVGARILAQEIRQRPSGSRGVNVVATPPDDDPRG